MFDGTMMLNVLYSTRVWYGIVCKGGYGWVGMVSTWGLTLMIYLIDG